MKWVLVSNASAALQEHDLMANDERKVILKYNPRHQSVRVTSGNHQRLFYLESAGSLSGKTIFKNEYGMETGSLSSERSHGQEGAVLIDEKKYHYALNNTLRELAIYPVNSRHSLITCELSDADNHTIMLLGICWYLSLAVEKQTTIEYAA